MGNPKDVNTPEPIRDMRDEHVVGFDDGGELFVHSRSTEAITALSDGNRLNHIFNTALMKSIPMGIQDFKEIRESDIYYVDKTRLIADVLNSSGTKVFLFTRPRRFGKSINLSMLDAYLNNRYEGNSWFTDLAVTNLRPNDPEKNSNAVINLDMKNLGDGTYDGFVEDIGFKIVRLFSGYPELTESNKINPAFREMFADIYHNRDLSKLSKSLYLLSMILSAHTDGKVILLIDEYDNAVNNAKDDEERGKILSFLRVFLGESLKGNEYLRFAVLTGVMRIAKESIFSGLNNLRADSVLVTGFGEAFGFTPAEVEKLCADYGHPEKYEEAKEWYDGYRFGTAEVYNPWSVLSYIQNSFSPSAYWAGTSGNDIIDRMIDGSDADVFDDFRNMARGEEVVASLSDSVAYADIFGDVSKKNLYSVMAASGYLRAVPAEGEFEISIPNKEMYTVFEEKFVDYARNSGDRIRRLKSAVVSGDVDAVAKSMTEFATKIDPKIMSHEHAYEILTIALLMNLEGPYTVENEIHTGKGYCDIMLRSNIRSLPHAVIELKRGKQEEDAEALALSALNQIREKEYGSDLNGPILMYGVAFVGKEAFVATDRVGQRYRLRSVIVCENRFGTFRTRS